MGIEAEVWCRMLQMKTVETGLSQRLSGALGGWTSS
jgi:hypothetical protein